MATLESELQPLEPGLAKVLLAIAAAVVEVAETLRTASTSETGTSNLLGDKQLVADVAADAKVMAALAACGAVATGSSEEQPSDHALGGQGYSVAWDPLDGSSIIGANWAVGSVFGVWPGDWLVGRPGREQVAAAYAVHGPKTVLVLARPVAGADAAAGLVVQEFMHDPSAGWLLSRGDVRIPSSKKVFAPANLRASADNEAYRVLVQAWMAERYTLRYSGGMVPDMHHILAKGGGVFCNPASAAAPPKLRLLYEVLPLAFVVEAAGGASFDGRGSALDAAPPSHDARGVVCLGSAAEVERCAPAMRAGTGA